MQLNSTMTNLIRPVWMGGKNGLSDGNCLSEGTASGGTAVADGPTKNSRVRLTGWVDGGPIHAWAGGKTQRRIMYCQVSSCYMLKTAK